MFHNHFRQAVRALVRNGVHSVVNILGLSLGISACLLIGLYLHHEWTFDAFHSKADRIYRVFGREDRGENQKFTYTNTPYPMGPLLKESLPEVEKQVRIKNIETQVKVGDQQFTESTTIAGQDLFDVFDFEIVNGIRQGILAQQSNAVINTTLAQKYFGNESPINKVISIKLKDTFEEFTIVAVAEVPTNSSIQFDVLLSDLIFPRLYSDHLLTSSWFNISPETYVLLQEGTHRADVESKFPSLFRSVLGDEKFNQTKYAPGLQPLSTIHLSSNYRYPAGIEPQSDPKYSYTLAAIATLILILACLNFVTLAVGRSLKRAKEVGVRKVVGATRSQLVAQFLGEALLVTSVSIFVALAISSLTLPLLNDLLGKQLVLKVDIFLLSLLGSILVVISLISGSYPAFFLSSFRPASALKNRLQFGKSKQELRKVLVGIQLVLSTFLISSTLLMTNQIRFLQTKNLGFDGDQVISIPVNTPRQGPLAEYVKKGFDKASILKHELEKSSEVAGVSIVSHDFGAGNWLNIGYTDMNGTFHTFNVNMVDSDYIALMNMEVIQGRGFSTSSASDSKHAVIVNEAFVKDQGWDSAVGKRLPGNNFADHEIIGVIKDFHYAPLYEKVGPLVLVQNISLIMQGADDTSIDNPPTPKLLIKLNAGDITSLDRIKGVWEKVFGNEEFNFSFVEQSLNAQYRNDRSLGKIVSMATFLGIIIAGIGLYGMASITLQNRTKEISIRKICGATEYSLLILLSRSYMILAVFCFALSIPLAIYFVQDWLARFEYKVTVSWGTFALSGAISASIVIFTIAFEVLKTARVNPARTVKYE